MPKTDLQKTQDGASQRRRRAGYKGWDRRRGIVEKKVASMFSPHEPVEIYEDFELNKYDGSVKRVILLTKLKGSEHEEKHQLTFDQARVACSGWAEIEVTEDCKFTEYDGKQVRYLLTLENVFEHPSLQGALAELFDSGCAIQTRGGTLTLKSSEIEKCKGFTFAKAA